MKDYKGGFSNQLGLFGQAEKSKISRNFIWFSILAYLVMLISGIIPAIIGEVLLLTGTISYLVNTVIFTLILGFGMLTLFIALIVIKREKRSFRDIGFSKDGALSGYVKGFGIGILLMGISTIFIWGLGGFKFIPNSQGVGIKFIPTILFMLTGWIIQGATEEILCRGWMLPLLGRKYNVPFAIFITSLFFMLMHSSNDSMSLLSNLNLFLFALFAALYVVKEKSLWGICGMHSAWNWMQGNILGIEVSGMDVPGGSLLKFQATGSAFISGGRFGVEASLICTVVLILASIYIFINIKKEAAYSIKEEGNYSC